MWTFELDNVFHEIMLECSFLTNKRRIYLDKNLIYSGSKPLGKKFFYSFNLRSHVLSVESDARGANLLVDSLNFYKVLFDMKWDNAGKYSSASDVM